MSIPLAAAAVGIGGFPRRREKSAINLLSVPLFSSTPPSTNLEGGVLLSMM